MKWWAHNDSAVGSHDRTGMYRKYGHKAEHNNCRKCKGFGWIDFVLDGKPAEKRCPKCHNDGEI